jgi:hypothetical protein
MTRFMRLVLDSYGINSVTVICKQLSNAGGKKRINFNIYFNFANHDYEQCNLYLLERNICLHAVVIGQCCHKR